MTTTMSGSPRGPVPLLEATGLTVTFGTVTALDGLDLTEPAGQVLAILGPNGAGKPVTELSFPRHGRPGRHCPPAHH